MSIIQTLLEVILNGVSVNGQAMSDKSGPVLNNYLLALKRERTVCVCVCVSKILREVIKYYIILTQ